MATTGRIGSTAAYLLEPGHGSTAFVEDIGAVVASAGEAALVDAVALVDEALLVAAASTDAAALLVADPDSPRKAGLHVAGQLDAGLLVVASAVVAVAPSTVEVAAVSTVEVAVDSTAVVAATVAATGSSPRFSL
jgi:hypothetical protein